MNDLHLLHNRALARLPGAWGGLSGVKKGEGGFIRGEEGCDNATPKIYSLEEENTFETDPV